MSTDASAAVPVRERKEPVRGRLWHSIGSDEVFAALGSSPDGLSSPEAVRRLGEFGTNEIPDTRKVSPLRLFLRQFNSILVYVLAAAGAISYGFGHALDMYVIAAVIVANAIIGFLQEYRAERAMAALIGSVVYTARVLRDGELVEIPASRIVPGDIVLVENGDRVPADIRLVSVREFRVVEAALTGESLPIDKETGPGKKELPVADRRNMAWMGTYAVSGSARGIAVGTGPSTALGEIAATLSGVKVPESHFSEKARKLAMQTGIGAAAVSAIVFVIGYFVRDLPFSEMLLFTVATLVSGIPEGLPAILTVVLAVGAHRMSLRRAIVRSLPVTETLGVADVIITDKTGTLTENSMMIETIALPSGRRVHVTGEGWAPKGTFSEGGQPMLPLEDPDSDKLLHAAALANGSTLVREPDGSYRVLGDPTEGALAVLAEKAGLKKSVLSDIERIVEEVAFDHSRGFRASLIERDASGGPEREIYIAGAPERVIARCASMRIGGTEAPFGEAEREGALQAVEELSNKALRVLALASRPLPGGEGLFEDHLAEGAVFLGLVGMKDPLRAAVPEAILRAKEAGIRVIMATGDHKATALAIGREAGIISDSRANAYTEVDLATMSEAEFADAVRSVSVFARLSPSMKLRIAESLQKDGRTVAMTGDGVNDAPALKRADIGIAMGKVGTDVARESAGLVLADDNFATIIDAIEEGRAVFENTRRASVFLVTTNLAENATILATIAFGMPLPLAATQILWLNLITDGFTGIPLALEPGHGRALKRPPRARKEEILTKEVIPLFCIVVSVMLIATFTVFSYFLPEGLHKARTGAFAVMSFTQLFNVFNVRSFSRSVFSIGVFSNRAVVWGLLLAVAAQGLVFAVPFLRDLFRFVPLSLGEWGIILAASSFVLWFGELYKFIRYRRRSAAERSIAA